MDAYQEILFVDASLTDLSTILASLSPNIEIVRLDRDSDGLTQIDQHLQGHSEVTAIHIVSHGASGQLTIGSGVIDAATLSGQASTLASIGSHLSANADILLYGCDIAAGSNGVAFIGALADATGADVSASTNNTGASQSGGDWVLEAHVGPVQTIPINASDYDGTLGDDSQMPSSLNSNTWGSNTFQTRKNGEITTSDPLNPSRSGCYWDRYTLSGVANGTIVKLYMGNSSTIDDYLMIDRGGSVITSNDDAGDGERSYDAYLSWTYQAGDVIRATTFSAGSTGSYSLWIGTSSGATPVPTDVGNTVVLPPPPTAPTFTDGYGAVAVATYTDTGAIDTFSATSGTLTATDTTPNGMTFSGGSVGTYGTLGVASGGSFTFTPKAAAINALAAGVNDSSAFTVYVTDGGGLSSSKTLTFAVSGANDAPTLSSNVIMSAVFEDIGATSAANPGLTVFSLFGGRFADVDNSSSIGGIVIVGNAEDAAKGYWQYSTDGTAWHNVGTVSTASGLALSAATRLHFVPALNFNGTAVTLTVNATDNNFTGTYSSGATHGHFDTTTDVLTSGASVGTVTLSTSVTAVNDIPTFTSGHGGGTAAIADTASPDTTFTPTAPSTGLVAAADSLSGSLAATDIETTDATQLVYSIRGGTLATGVWTAVGKFGTLTLNANKTWNYVPSNDAAINAIPAGTQVTDVFDFTVADPQGAFTTQSLTITVTGANDTPIIASSIVDQTFSGAGSWLYQIPAASFTDAEGAGLTYTVQLVTSDTDATPLDPDGGGALAAGALPSWLTFDETTRTFSGNPPAAWADATLYIKVTASDGTASISDTFHLTLSGTANQPPVVANPLTWHAVNAPKEVTQVTFTSSLGGKTIIFDGHAAITLGAQAEAAVVATAVLGKTYPNWTDSQATATKVRFTQTGSGDVTDSTYYNVINGGNFDGTATVAKVQDGIAAVTGTHETFVLTLANNDSQARTLIFQGVSHDIAASATADAIATALNGANVGVNWTASRTAAGQVTFTNSAHADQTDITIADFTGTYKPLATLPSVVESSVSNFLLQAVATDSVARTFVLDGASVTIDANQTNAQAAAQIAAHGAFGKWNTAVVESSTQVRFTDTDVAVVAPSSNTLITQKFDSTAAFTNNFTQSNPATGTFTWGGAVGIAGGPGVSITSGSDQVWTTKQSYTVTTNGVYTVSALFKSVENSGYGAIGFSLAEKDSNAGSSGAPYGTNLGAYFHGGGGGFLNNGVATSVSWGANPLWSGDPVAPGHWYKFVFTLTATGGNNYGMNLKIYNVADDGTLGAKFSEITTTVANSTVAAAGALRVFFSAEGSRMSAMDNFVIDLQNSTAIGTQTGAVVSTP